MNIRKACPAFLPHVPVPSGPAQSTTPPRPHPRPRLPPRPRSPQQACFAAVLLAGVLSLPARGANLQPQDLLFISTHKAPVKVVGDDRKAYVLTEGGVLVYDYGRKAWVDNLAPGQGVRDIRYSKSRSRLYAKTEGGRVLEYNSAFRRFTDGSDADFSAASDGDGTIPDLTGLSLEGEWFFLGDGVRDRYMRKAAVTGARVFDYDNLWVLSAGLGPFYGSSRRKRAAPAWFGLDDPACHTVHPEGGDVWFGGCRTDGSLVRASADLGTWKVYPAQLESGFGEGCIRDVRAWKDYVWLATEKGVVRHDPRRGQFKTYAHMQGSTYLPVHCLHVHEGMLYAGSEEGASFLTKPDEEFRSMPLPGSIRVPVYEFESKGKDIWAATRYGLYVYRAKDGNAAWMTLKELTGLDVPESYGQLIPSVRHRDTTLYWLSGSKIMFKPRGRPAKVLFDRDRPFRLRMDGPILYVAFHGGVTGYDTDKNLWTDFRLEDGIPGSRVLSMAVAKGDLWIGTDRGAARVRAKPYLP